MSTTRRSFLTQSVAAAALAACTPRALFASDEHAAPAMSPQQALDRLLAGNRRFVEGHATGRNYPARRYELTEGQTPFAAILCCSDSRVPPETVFDKGLGNIFVVRVAGNILTPVGLASLEYAVAHLGASLIFVLGHGSCGAVKAALDVRQKNAQLEGHLPELVKPILPAVDTALAGHPADALAACVHANVVAQMNSIRNAGPILAPRIANGSVGLAGGVYALTSGKVEQIT